MDLGRLDFQYPKPNQYSCEIKHPKLVANKTLLELLHEYALKLECLPGPSDSEKLPLKHAACMKNRLFTDLSTAM